MTLQIVAVNDAAPGACTDTGLTYDGSTTFTSTKIIAGTSMTMSGTAAITGNTTVGGTLGITGATTVGGTLAVTGITTYSDRVAFGAIEAGAASGSVVVDISILYSGYTTNSTAALTATLADGTIGQMKMIKLRSKDTNNLVVTPAHFNDGSTLTFDAAGEYALLCFVGSGWTMVAGTATIA